VEIKSKEIKIVDIDSIIPSPKNNNKHSEEQKKQLKKIIKANGFRSPLTISNRSGFLVKGHLRLEAAKELGFKELPVMYQDYDSEALEYADLTADNAIAMQSELDLSMINAELLNFDDFDLELLGLKDFELVDAEKLEPQCDEDEVPELKEDPITKRGDIWLLGNHRLMCGDSTMIDDVEKLMNGEKADLVHTDPPYGIKEKGDRTKRNGKNSLRAGVSYVDFDDSSTDAAVMAYDICENILKIPRQVWWGANYYCHHLPMGNNWFVWDKRVEDKQRDFNSDCELAWVKSKFSSVRIFRHLWKGLIKESERGQARVHPTQKPIALTEWCFDYYKDDLKNVLDLFGGSGSTLIACENKNKSCFMMEFTEHYCDVIINRWQNFTGKKATLESNGKTYEELKNGTT
jgi:DNA modification methylase